MVVMGIKLASQVYRRYTYKPINECDQIWKALKQILPLSAFPILFFIFEIPILLYHVYTTQHSTPSEGMYIATILCFSLWSASSGATVIIHISVVRICGRKRKHIKPVHLSVTRPLFSKLGATEFHAISATHFSLPPPSV